MSSRSRKKALDKAGIVAPDGRLSPEELREQLALRRRAGRLPNQRRVNARTAARGASGAGRRRWVDEDSKLRSATLAA